MRETVLVKKARILKRGFAASLTTCMLADAADASAHGRHFDGLNSLRGHATSSPGVIVFSAERPGALSCTATSNVLGIGLAAPDEPTGLGDDSGRPPAVPATLAPFLRSVDLDRPSAHDLALAGRDLQDAYVRGSISAGCEARILALASPLQPAGSAAPEPATWALMMLGVAMIGLAARRRRSAAVAA